MALFYSGKADTGREAAPDGHAKLPNPDPRFRFDLAAAYARARARSTWPAKCFAKPARAILEELVLTRKDRQPLAELEKELGP